MTRLPESSLRAALLIAGGILVAASSTRANWPQYHGPTLDNKTNESLADVEWPSQGPRTAWKVPTPTGFSSFAVADGKACTLVRREIEGIDHEVCLAVDAATGKTLWEAPLGIARYDGGGDSGAPDNKGGDGPRSTPSLHEGRVYAIDANVVLWCLDGSSGDVLWKKDVLKEHDGENIKWKNAASPLIDDGRLFLAGGGKGQALIAVDPLEGSTLWAVEDDTMTHATPVAATILGTRQVIFFTKEGLVSVKPEDGAVLWRYPFPFKVSTAASPVVHEDIVYCSAGYGVGAGAVRIARKGSGFEAAEIWRTPNKNINHWSTPLVIDGFLYGMFSFKEYGNGPFACVDIRTGEMQWSEEGFGPGNVILAGKTLLALTDEGELVAIDPSPKEYRELSRADVLAGKCWSTPVVSGGRIFARSTMEGACIDPRPR